MGHQLILSAHSEYFRALLDSGNGTASSFNENEENVVSRYDIDHKTMSVVLRDMYSLELPFDVTREKVTELLVTADRLQMFQLVTRCISLLTAYLKKTIIIQTYIMIEDFKPEYTAKKDILDQMKENKSLVARSKDFPLFVEKYPNVAVEFMQAVINCDCD